MFLGLEGSHYTRLTTHEAWFRDLLQSTTEPKSVGFHTPVTKHM